MADDFNTGAAMAELFQLLTQLNKSVDEQNLENAKKRSAADLQQFVGSAEVLRELSNILGLFFKAPPNVGGGDDELTDNLMQLIIKLRADARANKNFATADVIRDSLTEAGVVLEDRKEGTTWSAG